MPERTGDIVLGQLAAVVREALQGSPERWSYFTDSGQKGGFFGTLTPLTAADTSLPLAGRPSRPMSTTLRGAWTRPPRGFGATERLGIGRRVGRSHR